MSEIVNIPDENFRSFLIKLLGYKYNLLGYIDTKITKQKCEKIHYLSLEILDIRSLQGIEYFKSLKYLFVPFNQLSFLDLSKNKELLSIGVAGNNLNFLILNNNIIKIDEYKATITNFKKLTIVI